MSGFALPRGVSRCDCLPPSPLRVLLAVLDIVGTGKPVTVRAIKQCLGMRAQGGNWVTHCLRRLRKLGLVTWEYGQAGTIRPLARLERIS